MGSGVKQQALANAGTGQQMNQQLYGNSNQIYGSLAPQLEAEVAHPTGLTPQQMAQQNTAAQQSSGGSQAGAVGQGALLASRTKNAGAAQNAIAQSARVAGQSLSKAALSTQQQNANLQNRNQQAGLSGLEGLYGTELGGSEQALGLSNSALNVANNAKPGFWQQFAGGLANNLQFGMGSGNGGGGGQGGSGSGGWGFSI